MGTVLKTSPFPQSPRFRAACRWSAIALLALSAACRNDLPDLPSGAGHRAASTESAPSKPEPSPPLVAAARRQIGVVVHYDPAYRTLAYPGGDVPADRGVCTDVVIRAFRTQGLDLQQAIHEDMRAHFAAYPQSWGLAHPDPNIDHRRVPNQMRWFERRGWELPASMQAADYAPGDVVAWKLRGNGLLHIGIVSNRRSRIGTPLVIHNIGAGTREDDILFGHSIIGHYRPKPDRPTRSS